MLVLERLLKRHLHQNFDHLSMQSIGFKRSLSELHASNDFRRTRALGILKNILRIHTVVSKTKAFCKWSEVSREAQWSRGNKTQFTDEDTTFAQN